MLTERMRVRVRAVRAVVMARLWRVWELQPA